MNVPHLDLVIKRPPHHKIFKSVKEGNRVFAEIVEDYFRQFGEISQHEIILYIDKYLRSAKLYEYYKTFLEDFSSLIERTFKDYISVRIYSPKIIVGMGEQGTYEVGLTLHHVFGVPYIPGSALKGTLRRVFETFKESDKEIIKNIWGTQEMSGSVDFTDALLINLEGNQTGIYLEVLTKHIDTRKYDERENPTPVSFLAVKNAEFLFYIVPTCRKNSTVHLEYLYNTINELKQTNIVISIGAKTSAGFGRIEIKDIKLVRKGVKDH